MNIYLDAKKEEFKKPVGFFIKEISVLRTGRANPNILEGVLVEAYGVKNPLNGVAAISVPDGQSITITPWDKSTIKDIEKSIVNAELGVGVVNEGDKIRLTIPMMTEENRKDMVKKLNEKMEQARIGVRRVRDEVKDSIEKAEKDKEIPEDSKFRFIKELDEEVGKKNDEIKAIRDKKEKEIMTI